jgi:hypothetical protein
MSPHIVLHDRNRRHTSPLMCLIADLAVSILTRGSNRYKIAVLGIPLRIDEDGRSLEERLDAVADRLLVSLQTCTTKKLLPQYDT